jgi:hypothetical protein
VAWRRDYSDDVPVECSHHAPFLLARLLTSGTPCSTARHNALLSVLNHKPSIRSILLGRKEFSYNGVKRDRCSLFARESVLSNTGVIQATPSGIVQHIVQQIA